MVAAPLLATSLAAGCGSAGGFTLHLQPITGSNQAPFDGLDGLALRLHHPDGSAEELQLPALAGSPEVDGVEPVSDTWIDVLGSAGGAVLSYGRTGPVDLDSGELTRYLVFGSRSGAAAVGSLPLSRRGARLVAAGDGRYVLFGGRRGEDAVDQDTLISFDLSAMEAADLGMAGSEMPAYGSGGSGRTGMSATLLQGDDSLAGRILVAGGSDAFTFSGSPGTTAGAFLYDPATGGIQDLGEDAMKRPRSEHTAVQTARGDVVIFAGWAWSPDTSTLALEQDTEVFDREQVSFRRVSRNSSAFPGTHGAGAPFADAAFFCGGITFPSQSTWATQDACFTVANRQLDDAGTAPVPLAFFTMTPLQDGSLLVAGGISVTEDDPAGSNQVIDASDQAWRVDSDLVWTPVGPMEHARCDHVAVPLPDGRVLLAGGAPGCGMLEAGDTDPALACAEVFDPYTDSFGSLGSCSSSAADRFLPLGVQDLAAAADPDYGVLLAGGASQGDEDDSVSLWVLGPGS